MTILALMRSALAAVMTFSNAEGMRTVTSSSSRSSLLMYVVPGKLMTEPVSCFQAASSS